FDLSSIAPKSAVDNQFDIHDDNYGIPNPMISGLSATRQHIGYAHQLEPHEKNYEKNNIRMNMILLRNTQGLHAPMRLAMELKAAEKIGRLPFLPSSNMMKQVLLGKDEEIGFEDIFNIPEFKEQMGQPHAIVERSLGIL
ncbi:Proteasome maturation protein, partial [Eufriesea mexicana]